MANRRHFDEFLQQVWSRARADGDEVAAALKGHLRQPDDLIARYGGDPHLPVRCERQSLGGGLCGFGVRSLP
ncbi:MAG: hypothetical protein H7225_00950 [Massilia sp.]|nr:hypothetical protein [Aquabacterium sp.]